MACVAEEAKRRKYMSLIPTYNFSPVCIESMGAWGDSARDLIQNIGHHVCETTGDPRSTSFLVQWLALDVQRGNVASVMATLPSGKDWSEFGRLPILYNNYVLFSVIVVIIFIFIYFLHCLL